MAFALLKLKNQSCISLINNTKLLFCFTYKKSYNLQIYKKNEK